MEILVKWVTDKIKKIAVIVLIVVVIIIALISIFSGRPKENTFVMTPPQASSNVGTLERINP